MSSEEPRRGVPGHASLDGSICSPVVRAGMDSVKATRTVRASIHRPFTLPRVAPRSPFPMVQSVRRCRIAAVALLAVTGVACGSDDPVTTPTPTPTAITETFEGTLTVNGAATYPFVVVQAGLASAVLTTILPDTATVGVSLGTWN